MNLEQATPAQREAITTDEADVLVVAGPGAGKTATVVTRIERQISAGVDPRQIGAITFTNAGAGELSRRLPKKPDGEPVELGFCGTLHAFALRMLKEHGAPFGYGQRIAIISPESAQDLIESKAKTLGCKRPLKDLMKLKQAGRPARGTRLTVEQTVLTSYFDELRDAGVVDYDVLLTEFRDMLTSDAPEALLAQQAIRQALSYLYVDEVQDSAPIDWEIYLALPIAFKFYVGDPDQAIYSFRGGNVGGMLQHARRPWVKVILLEENFRSRWEICDAANRLIRHNKGRLDKVTKSIKGAGGVVSFMPPAGNEGEEISQVSRHIKKLLGAPEGDNSGPIQGASSPKEIAVLCRTNFIADAFRKTLTAQGVPVLERKVEELPRDWRFARAFIETLVEPENDALAFFYLIALNEKNGDSPKSARERAHQTRRAAAAAAKSINRFDVHLGRVSDPRVALEALAGQKVSREAHAIAVDRYRELPAGATMLDLALSLSEVREYAKDGEGEGVNVLTIHGAKGREFDVVFVVGFEDEAFPGPRAVSAGAEAIEEERRLAYVAITRARLGLYLTRAESRVTKWKAIVKRTPSRFIQEISL